MSAERIPDIVRRYFGAYRMKDRKIVEDLLTDDFSFTSPYDDAIDSYSIAASPMTGRNSATRNSLPSTARGSDRSPFISAPATRMAPS